MARAANRIRNKENILKLPKTIAEINLSDKYTVTFKGNRFLLHDNENNENRLLIFATEENLRVLSKCNEWYCDGTFGIVPNMFTQLYTIHGMNFDFNFYYFFFQYDS